MESNRHIFSTLDFTRDFEIRQKALEQLGVICKIIQGRSEVRDIGLAQQSHRQSAQARQDVTLVTIFSFHIIFAKGDISDVVVGFHAPMPSNGIEEFYLS